MILRQSEMTIAFLYCRLHLSFSDVVILQVRTHMRLRQLTKFQSFWCVSEFANRELSRVPFYSCKFLTRCGIFVKESKCASETKKKHTLGNTYYINDVGCPWEVLTWFWVVSCSKVVHRGPERQRSHCIRHLCA